MNKPAFALSIVFFFIVFYMLYENAVINTNTAFDCATASLDGYGLDMSPKLINSTDKSFSQMMGSIHLFKQTKEKYYFYAELPTQYGNLRHEIRIPKYGICPTVLGDYFVFLEATQAEIYKQFMNDEKSWGQLKN